jgi:predicted nucleotidyltransferase component of viral defense system
MWVRMPLRFSEDVLKKLAEKHNVSEAEVRQCFENRDGNYIKDTREEHRTDPPTYWFVSETNKRRVLKVCFIARKINTESGSETRVEIKTAYAANVDEIDIYNRIGKTD